MSSESSFPIHSNISHSDYEGGIQADIHPMIFIDSFPQQFYAQNTRQPSSSLVGKSQNFLVSNTMSLVYLAFMSCISFIGCTTMELDFLGIFLHMSGHDPTTYGLMFKSPNHPGSLNCQCDLVSHSSPTMDPFTHGDTIPLIFSVLYELYFNILRLVIFVTNL